jgi:hypothetical protein
MLSSSDERFESDGSPSDDIGAVAVCVPIRRSNSASVILGLVRAVRLSGPGIPPRRIALLIDHPPALVPPGSFVSQRPWNRFCTGYLIWFDVLLPVKSVLPDECADRDLRGFQIVIIPTDQGIRARDWMNPGKIGFCSRAICLCSRAEAIVKDERNPTGVSFAKLD